MNRLNRDKQERAIAALIEGSSIRSTERMTGVHRDTIMRLMVRVGTACEILMDEEMRGLRCGSVQVDELWGYVAKKNRNIRPEDDVSRMGDFWIYTAIDRETKLVPCFRVGKRDRSTTHAFICDLASRVEGRIQISSDSLPHYLTAIEAGFGGQVDYGQIVKTFASEPSGRPRRYSPPKVVGVRRTRIVGNPDPGLISTSHCERMNLSTRMSMRRLTRLTNAFSKKVENLRAATALHFASYNYVKRHRSLRVTPAMAANVTDRLWSVGDLVALAD